LKPFWKTLTFWISALTWLALVGGHYALLESLTALPVRTPRLLVLVSSAISGLLFILHNLNGSVKPGQFGVPYDPSDNIVTKPVIITTKLPDTHHTTNKE
jgi:hypothetical protein